jgi:hypothetical protein
MKSMSSSKLDFEISCISLHQKLKIILFILETLNQIIDQGRDFEITNAILALTLRNHETFICENSDSFKSIMLQLSSSIKSKWAPLEDLMQSSICLLSFSREQ